MNALVIKAVDTVRQHWGHDAPDWVMRLARACDQTSQAEVARKIYRSGALVNQVLKRRYPGRMDRVEFLVKQVFGDTVCQCPVLGRIKAEECLGHQKKPYDGSNHQAVALFRACRSGCPFSTIKDRGK